MQNEGRFLIDFDQKTLQFICYKRFTVLKTLIMYGLLNGDIKLFLAPTRATKREHAYFNNNFNLEIQKLFIDPVGRFIICDVKANEKSLTLANIYAPNEDNPAFFLDFFEHLDDFKCDDIIIGGEFNLVLDLEKDRTGGLAKTHRNSVKIIQECSEKLDLMDAWRVLNISRFTWRRRRPKIQCRLDFFLGEPKSC